MHHISFYYVLCDNNRNLVHSKYIGLNHTETSALPLCEESVFCKTGHCAEKVGVTVKACVMTGTNK